MNPPNPPADPREDAGAREMEIVTGERMVLIGKRAVVVREMSWKAASNFLTVVGLRVGNLLKAAMGGVATASRDLAITPALVVQVLSEHCAEELIVATSEITAAELENMPARYAVQLLEAAIEMNVHPEMINSGKAVAARLGAAWKASA